MMLRKLDEASAGKRTLQRLRRKRRALSVPLGLACVAVAIVAAPAADAAAGDPKPEPSPQELWNAFPLNPNGERVESGGQQVSPTAPLKPPELPQAAAGTPSQDSQTSRTLLAVAGGAGALILATLAVFVLARSNPVRLRLRTAWPAPSPIARLRPYADIGAIVYRVRHGNWTETGASVLVGSAAAVVASFVIIMYLAAR